jgi:hypothetical protein
MIPVRKEEILPGKKDRKKYNTFLFQRSWILQALQYTKGRDNAKAAPRHAKEGRKEGSKEGRKELKGEEGREEREGGDGYK